VSEVHGVWRPPGSSTTLQAVRHTASHPPRRPEQTRAQSLREKHVNSPLADSPALNGLGVAHFLLRPPLSSIATQFAPPRRPCPAPAPPAWADAWVGRSAEPQTTVDFAHGVAATVRHGTRYSGVTARIDHARQRDDLDLQQAVVRAYGMIQTALTCRGAGGPRTPLRFWNFVPGIVNTTGGGLDRYMVFNAGRFAAFADWFNDTTYRPTPEFDQARFNRCIPTATGVGHAGDDLIIHALAAALPGRPIENPRQRAAYRYSGKYGPLPPCFARATLLPDAGDNQDAATDSPSFSRRRTLLIGGTASVCGEASVHAGDLVAQTAETFRNLDALIRAAGGTGVNAIQNLRVYHTHAAHREPVRNAVAHHMRQIDGTVEIEWVHAPLCRTDLDVEIEGVATLD